MSYSTKYKAFRDQLKEAIGTTVSLNPNRGELGVLNDSLDYVVLYTNTGQTKGGKNEWGPPYYVIQEQGKLNKDGKIKRDGSPGDGKTIPKNLVSQYSDWSSMMETEAHKGVAYRDADTLRKIKTVINKIKKEGASHNIVDGVGPERATTYYTDYIDKQLNGSSINAKGVQVPNVQRFMMKKGADGKFAYLDGTKLEDIKNTPYQAPRKWDLSTYSDILTGTNPGMGEIKPGFGTADWKANEEIGGYGYALEKLNTYEERKKTGNLAEHSSPFVDPETNKVVHIYKTAEGEKGAYTESGGKRTVFNMSEEKIAELTKSTRKQAEATKPAATGPTDKQYEDAINDRISKIPKSEWREMHQTNIQTGKRGKSTYVKLDGQNIHIDPNTGKMFPISKTVFGSVNQLKELKGKVGAVIQPTQTAPQTAPQPTPQPSPQPTQQLPSLGDGSEQEERPINPFLQQREEEANAKALAAASAQQPSPQPTQRSGQVEGGISALEGKVESGRHDPLYPKADPQEDFSDLGQYYSQPSMTRGESYYEMMRDPEIKEGLDMKKKLMTEGIDKNVRNEFSERLAAIMGRAEGITGLRLGGLLGGSADPARVQAQQQSYDEANIKARGDIERDIALKAEEIKRGKQGVQGYGKTVGELKKFDIVGKASAKQRDLERKMHEANLASQERIK